MFSILKGHEGYHFNKEMGGWEYIPSDNWIFAKVFRKNANGVMSSAPAMLPSKFELLRQEEPTNLDEALVLINELSTNPSLLAVRGKLKEDVPSPFKRNSSNFDVDIPSNIIAMDMDSIPYEGAVDLNAWAEHVVGMLHELSPLVFGLDLGYIVHASSSAGIKPGVRMHMLIHSSKAVCQGQIKGFFSDLNFKSKGRYGHELVDLNFYSATQPHFFADPEFGSGVSNPFSGKSRIIYKKGASCEFQGELPKFVSRRADVSKTDFQIFEMIEGREDDVPSVEAVMEELAEAKDNVYLRILPKLFHKAWQEGYSIKKLEERVRPILHKYISSHVDNNRTISSYINNAKTEALRVFLGEAKRLIPPVVNGVNVKFLEVDSAEDELFLKLGGLPPEQSVCFIKASLGTGKTTSVSRWLNEPGLVNGRFLTITNTVTLVESNGRKFGAGNYSDPIDVLNFVSNPNGRLSTTLHSLHKLKHIADEIEFLFIDECDAVMNDILFSTIVSSKGSGERDARKIEIAETLQTIMTSAKYIVLSDGDISEETINAYGSLIEFNKPLVSYNHQRRMMHSATAVEFCDEGSVWAMLQNQLQQGNKSILVSDCSPDILNKYGLMLRQTTGQVIKEVHSRSTEDEDIAHIINYTNEALKEQGIVGLLCSPSITGGVDFNYFENVFVITKQSVQSPNLRFQALRRDRGARRIFYYTSKETKGFNAGASCYVESGIWLDTARQLYASRREGESKNYPNTFRFYLIDQGCPIKIVSKKSSLVLDSDIDYDVLYEAQRIFAVMESVAGSSMPRHNDAYEVKNNIVKYYHLESISEVTEELVLRFLQEKPDTRAEFFHKIYPILWEDIKKCTPTSLKPFREALKNKSKEFYIATSATASPHKAKQYLIMAGIDDLSDLTNIKDWYKTYCVENGLSIPAEFLSEEEQMLVQDSAMELE